MAGSFLLEGTMPRSPEQIVAALTAADDPLQALRELFITTPQDAMAARDHCGGATTLAREIGLHGETATRYARKIFAPPRTNREVVTRSHDDLAGHLLTYLGWHRNRSTPFPPEALAATFDCTVPEIRVAVEMLREQGICVMEFEGSDLFTIPRTLPEPHSPISINFTGDRVVAGWVSDTHFGSVWAAEDFLGAAYGRFEAVGVQIVFHIGDMMEGPAGRGYPGHANDVKPGCADWRGQVQYTHERYPSILGVTTHFIESATSHEGWEWKNSPGRSMGHILANGVELPSHMVNDHEVPGFTLPGRDDLNFLGHDRRTIGIGPEEKTTVMLLHPGGASSKYPEKKLAEYIEGLDDKQLPHILAMGHLHRFAHIDSDVLGLMVPSCQFDTPLFQRSVSNSNVGAIITELELDTGGDILSYQLEVLRHPIRD